MVKYIERLYAKDTGVFHELNVKFNPQFNFIVGPNGSGKTSMLKCIALALSPSSVNSVRCKESSVLWFDAFVDEVKFRVGLGEGWVSNAETYRNSGHKSWTKPIQAEGIAVKNVDDLDNENINITPLILGAYRRIEYKRIEGMHRESNLVDQRRYYHNSGVNNIEGGNLPDVKQWMINRYFQIEKDWAEIYKNNWSWIIENIDTISPRNCELHLKKSREI